MIETFLTIKQYIDIGEDLKVVNYQIGRSTEQFIKHLYDLDKENFALNCAIINFHQKLDLTMRVKNNTVNKFFESVLSLILNNFGELTTFDSVLKKQYRGYNIYDRYQIGLSATNDRAKRCFELFQKYATADEKYQKKLKELEKIFKKLVKKQTEMLN